MPDVILAAESLRVRFGAFTALRDVSLNLHGGDLLGLIGPNGAGKTTLLRALAGLQPLTRGVVRILGEPLVPDALHLKRHIGFTPDTPGLYDDLTVHQFLRFIAKGYDLSDREANERIDFWLEKVWLTEKVDMKVRALSRGMRQRVGLARTLIPNPNIILLDEPSAGLDPAGRVQFRNLLCSLRDQGKALIVSSHILLDMPDYCTHIGIMSKGEIVRLGTVNEIAASGDNIRCRYSIVLAHPVAGISSVLEAIPGVSKVGADTDRLTLEYGAAKDDAAELLSRLMGKNIPIAAFAPITAGLEEAYLRSEVSQVD